MNVPPHHVSMEELVLMVSMASPVTVLRDSLENSVTSEDSPVSAQEVVTRTRRVLIITQRAKPTACVGMDSMTVRLLCNCSI